MAKKKMPARKRKVGKRGRIGGMRRQIEKEEEKDEPATAEDAGC